MQVLLDLGVNIELVKERTLFLYKSERVDLYLNECLLFFIALFLVLSFSREFFLNIAQRCVRIAKWFEQCRIFSIQQSEEILLTLVSAFVQLFEMFFPFLLFVV